MFLGHEQIHSPEYSLIEKTYIAIFGIPILGLRIRARNVFALIPKDRKYDHILDAGSGSGVFSFALARRFPETRILGIDPAQESVAACEHIAKKLRITNVKFRPEPIERLAEKNFFDLILCVDILEHIQDDRAALQILYAAAAPDSVLILHVPALHRRYPFWKKSLNFDVATHVRIGYIPHDLNQKVQQAGFSIQASGFTYGIWETWANNLSYMITRARMQNKLLYAFVFPCLSLIGSIGTRARPKNLGAGVFVVAEKSRRKRI